MATEQASGVTTDSASLARWSSWLAALVGLWVLASPFVLSGPISSGTVLWSNVVSGALVLVLAAFGAYEVRTATTGGALSEWSAWIAAVAGIWILASPFVLAGSITVGTPLWSNVIAGLVVAVIAAYAGYAIR